MEPTIRTFYFFLLAIVITGCGKRLADTAQTQSTDPKSAEPSIATRETPLRAYFGIDGVNPCELRVWKETAGTDSTPYSAEVSTSYTHGESSPGKRVLHLNSDRLQFDWFSPDGEEYIKVFLFNESTNLDQPDYFEVRWKHEYRGRSHFHLHRCERLREIPK